MAILKATALVLVLVALGTSAEAQVPAARPTPEKLAPIAYVQVPDLSGLNLPAAGQLLNQRNLRLGVTASTVSSARPPGTVVGQKPAPNTRVQTGSAINVWIAKAPAPDDVGTGTVPEQRVRVPNVIGLAVTAARQAVAQAGLQISKTDTEASTEPRGTVIGQAPGAGELVRRGQSIELRTSDGSLTVVPDLRGASRDEADLRLRARGLRLAGSGQQESTAPAGRILRHSPVAGTTVPRGTGVDIVVAKGPSAVPPVDDRVQVPDLSGRELSAVAQILGGLKLRLGKTGTRVSSAGRFGTVIDQDPAPKTSVARGSVVNVWIAEAGKSPPSATVPPPQSPDQLVVPNVVGLTTQTAQQALSQAGLQPGKVATEASTEPRGRVLAQTPQAGALVRRGAPVDLRSSDGGLTVVPDLRGRSRQEADALLQARDLRISGSTERESTTAAGRIIQHIPAPGSRVPRDSGVTIVVAKASTLVVPDLAGVPLEEARSRLAGSRLTLGGALPAPGEQPAGTVLTQDPPAGRAVPVGTAVHLAVSDGTLTRVPALGGLSEAAAQERLRELGLAPGQRADEESPQSPGEIVRQALAAGVLVARGTRLDYTVAVPQMHDVPKVTGLPLEEAAARLRALGLRITAATRRHDAAAEGTVIAQRPEPPARVQIGTEVAVEVSSGPRLGTLGFILGVGAVLAAIGVVAVKVARPAHGTESPTVQVTAHVAVPDVPARSAVPLKVEGPVVRIRARLETGPARVSEDRLVVRRERGNS